MREPHSGASRGKAAATLRQRFGKVAAKLRQSCGKAEAKLRHSCGKVAAKLRQGVLGEVAKACAAH
eukprot:11867461-Alexandrium_andersonii.AAC.1